MINLVSELLENISISNQSIGFRYLNLGGKILYLIGFKSVLKFGKNEITFKIDNKTIISVKGEDLYIKEMDNCSAMICGSIFSVESI